MSSWESTPRALQLKKIGRLDQAGQFGPTTFRVGHSCDTGFSLFALPNLPNSLPKILDYSWDIWLLWRYRFLKFRVRSWLTEKTSAIPVTWIYDGKCCTCHHQKRKITERAWNLLYGEGGSTGWTRNCVSNWTPQPVISNPISFRCMENGQEDAASETTKGRQQKWFIQADITFVASSKDAETLFLLIIR